MRFRQIDDLAARTAEALPTRSAAHRERLHELVRTVLVEKLIEPKDAPTLTDAEKEAARHVDLYV